MARPPKSPRLYLEHMQEAIEDIERFTAGMTYEQFLADRKTQAVERRIEALSEASRHVPEAMKADRAEIPWRGIAGIGHILRHVYDRVRPRRRRVRD
jgi:uncharacterized protein with HEPN domain